MTESFIIRPMAAADFAVLRSDDGSRVPRWLLFDEERQMLVPAHDFNRTVFESLAEAKAAIDTHNATFAATDASWLAENPPITYP